MGFSPGDFKSAGEQLHWEGKTDCIILWNDVESKAILRLDLAEARKALSHLELLVNMLEADNL